MYACYDVRFEPIYDNKVPVRTREGQISEQIRHMSNIIYILKVYLETLHV